MMKIRKMAGVSAFVFAMALAFAFSNADVTPTFNQAYGPFDTGCDLGDLQQENCSTQNEGVVCTVIINEGTPAQEIETAHIDSGCVTMLRQPLQ
ncbi:hypothetical protein [Sinomicrobium sp. M5D2P9]